MFLKVLETKKKQVREKGYFYFTQATGKKGNWQNLKIIGKWRQEKNDTSSLSSHHRCQFKKRMTKFSGKEV